MNSNHISNNSKSLQAGIVQSERPRDVGLMQSIAILYGDWGTSKIYVIGIAYAIAGQSSFWLILASSILSILVGLCYTLVCKYYPNGGGVYASVRHRSEIFALLGGFFLTCDFIITAALSSLAAFEYLGFPEAYLFAIGSIALIGLINFLGPRHTGNLAFIVAVACAIMIFFLGVMSLPHLGEALQNLQPLKTGWLETWVDFVSIIVALSGIEAIANMTGVMRLNPHSKKHPSVTNISTPAIVLVMLEICFFTALFALMVNALPGLTVQDHMVSAPGIPNVRDSMLKYMGQIFCSSYFPESFCFVFSNIFAIVVALLLFSAVNTAIVALNSLFYVMAKDGQLPSNFLLLNRFGVPVLGLFIASITPIIILYIERDVLLLSQLYAIGFVGAIATNLTSTSTDKSLNLRKYERYFMFIAAMIMIAIEITLFIYKPNARNFVITVVAFGLFLRALVLEQKSAPSSLKKDIPVMSINEIPSSFMMSEKKRIARKKYKNIPFHNLSDASHIHNGALLVAVTHIGKSIEFALKEALASQQPLYIVFIREQKIISQDVEYSWLEDEKACEIFDYIIDQKQKNRITFLYEVSHNPALSIVEIAKKLNVATLILGVSRMSRLLQMIRGNVISTVFNKLPIEIDLIIVS